MLGKFKFNLIKRIKKLAERHKITTKIFWLELWWAIQSHFRHSWLGKLKWAFIWRFHPDHQYNKLNTGLPPAYYDLDKRILYAVMNEFKIFWETEGSSQKSWGNENKEDHPYMTDEEWENYSVTILQEAKDEYKELVEVYNWWNGYLHFYKENDDAYYWKDMSPASRIKQRAYLDFEEKMEEEANTMLIKIIQHRRKLWT